MAQAIPCAICQEVAEADWLLTNRSDDWSDDNPRTFGCCQLCMIKMSLQMVGIDPDTILGGSAEVPDQALPDAESVGDVTATAQEPLPGEPGVLEQIESAEGVEQVAPANGRARKSKAAQQAEPVAQVTEEAASADVDG